MEKESIVDIELTHEQTLEIFALYLHSEVIFNGILRFKIDGINTQSFSNERHSLIGHNDDGSYFERPLNMCQLVLKSTDTLSSELPNEIANWNSENYVMINQYLMKLGYAVSLFIEKEHPLNGKTAIELGLAVDESTLEKKQELVRTGQKLEGYVVKTNVEFPVIGMQVCYKNSFGNILVRTIREIDSPVKGVVFLGDGSVPIAELFRVMLHEKESHQFPGEEEEVFQLHYMTPEAIDFAFSEEMVDNPNVTGHFEICKFTSDEYQFINTIVDFVK